MSGMALRKLVQKAPASAGQINPAVTLLRDVFREVPRILTIYDIDLADRDVRVSPQPLSRTPSLLSPAGVPAAPPLRAHLVHARMLQTLAQARRVIMKHFRKHEAIADKAVKDILIMKGYMELEETKMQYKQTTHLRRMLDPTQFDEEPEEAAPTLPFKAGEAGSLASGAYGSDADKLKAKLAALRAKLAASKGPDAMTTPRVLGGVGAY